MNYPTFSRYQVLFGKLLTLCLLFGTAANAQADSDYAVGLPSDVRFEMDREGALIKSQEDLERYFSGTGSAYSPLNVLSDQSKELFLSSLQFGKNGLASFRHDVLEQELAPTQIYAILELFGFQESIVNMQNARIETERDIQLIGLSSCDGGIGTGDELCDGEYAEGRCAGPGTCVNTAGYTCHPPSCP